MSIPTTKSDSGRSTMVTLAYKIMQHIQDRRFEKYDYADLDELEELVKTAEPGIHFKFVEENYAGPNDGEAWSGGIADNH